MSKWLILIGIFFTGVVLGEPKIIVNFTISTNAIIIPFKFNPSLEKNEVEKITLKFKRVNPLGDGWDCNATISNFPYCPRDWKPEPTKMFPNRLVPIRPLFCRVEELSNKPSAVILTNRPPHRVVVYRWAD
jgi:hypothetical protein